MYEYWNDPPDGGVEPPGCPECADGFGEYLTGSQTIQMWGCDCCGHRWLIPVELDIEPEDFDEPWTGTDFSAPSGDVFAEG